MISASAPAGNASSISGKLSAASTNATSDGDDDSDVISQPAPTSCIQVPTLETIVAIHRLRNSVVCSGVQAPDGGRMLAGAPALAGGAVFIGKRYHSRPFEFQHERDDAARAPTRRRPD